MYAVNAVRDFSRRFYPPHNWQGHIIPVRDLSLRLADVYGGERSVVEPAAYMHDLGRVMFPFSCLTGFYGHEESGSLISRAILQHLGADKALAERVSHCILTHAGKGNSRFYPQESELEENILMNADALSQIDHMQAFYLFAVHFHDRGQDLAKTRDWVIGKLRSGWDNKLTLPGVQELSAGEYLGKDMTYGDMQEAILQYVQGITVGDL